MQADEIKTQDAPRAEEEVNPFGKPPVGLRKLNDAPTSRVQDTTEIQIERIDLKSKSDRKRFLGMVEPIYRGDPNFIMPLWFERMKFLDPEHSAAMENLDVYPMLALKGGQLMGRMTAHIDHAYNQYHDAKAGWFGFFESVDDDKVAHAMLAEGTSWLASKGMTECIGPMNFSTNGQCGLLIENFDRPPAVEMTYNPPYYARLLESFGMVKAKDLFAWWIDVSEGTDNKRVKRIARIAERVKRREGIHLRQTSKSRFEQEVKLLFDLYNAAWQKNWGFVPIGEDEFKAVAKDLKPIVREELCLIIEVKGRPVGFSLALPDVNEVMPKDGRLFPLGWWGLTPWGLKKIKHARLMVLGVVPEFRKRGLESLLFVETALRARAIGITSGELGWTLEDNHLINRAIESMDGRLDRKYRLYGVDLTD